MLCVCDPFILMFYLLRKAISTIHCQERAHFVTNKGNEEVKIKYTICQALPITSSDKVDSVT
jgi:hypothetical protein